MHQHGPHCQHGHQHGPQQGHAHGPMQMMGMGPQVQEESPEQYFRNLKKRWSDPEMRVFFWQQLLHGVIIDKTYERFGLDFMRSLNCQAAQLLVMSVENMVNFQFIPSRLRPITSGLFFPLLFLLFFNYNVVVGVAATDEWLRLFAIITLTLYVLTSLRGHSKLRTEQMQSKTMQIVEVRPYLGNPQMTCTGCGVIRLFRAFHCPYCKTCVAKHSRHSLVFGSCIGAANQFLAMLFFLSLTITLGLIIALFYKGSTYGMLTKFMFYLLNVPLCWMSFTEFMQFLVFNLIYGVTEQELKMWPMMQYLQKIPEKGFQNNMDQGFLLNLQGSLMALFGISGYQSEEGWAKPSLVFPIVESDRDYRVNWSKAVVYLIPQLPFHKNRGHILQMMQRDEPKMIEMFRLQAKFRQQVMAEAGADQLNEFQIQQKLAMKMQAHMMKNMPQMAMPTTQQQRNIQLQMLAHMKKQFASEPDLQAKMIEIQSKLKQGGLTPIETNMQMRMLQQQLMGRRMSKAMKQMQEQKQPEKNKNQQEEAPMHNMADEDL